MPATLQKKYISAEESGSLDANSSTFGRVRPRQEVTEDVAVSAVPAVSMGKFSLEQVRDWLLAVAREIVVSATATGSSGATAAIGTSGAGAGIGAVGEAHKSYEQEALKVYQYIAGLVEKAADGGAEASTTQPANTTTTKVRELPKSTIFGTVTVSSRLKRYRTTSTSGNGSNGCNENSSVLRAGQYLLRVQNITAALHYTAPADASTAAIESKSTDTPAFPPGAATEQERAEDHRQAEILFREAVIRRSQYDAALQEYERVVGLQSTRMRIEDQVSTNFQASVLNARKPTSAAATPTASVKVEEGVDHGAGAGAAVEGQLQSKRARTDGASVPTSANAASVSSFSSAKAASSSYTSQSAAVSASAVEEAEEEMLDFDLEELVGGPVTSADKSKYANLSRASNGNNASSVRDNGVIVGNGNGRAGHIASQRSTSHAQHLEGSSSGAIAGPSAGGAGAASVSGAGAAAPSSKKVGMKPRPKIVIS